MGLEPQVQVAVRGGPHPGAHRSVMRLRGIKMLDYLQLRGVELSIALVDDQTIHQLNREYRSVDRPTDVLAFAMNEGLPEPTTPGVAELLGDVVISVPTARRQAQRSGRPLLAELTTLLAHGLLHLLGYDHAERCAARQMKSLRLELEQAAVKRGPTTRK